MRFVLLLLPILAFGQVSSYTAYPAPVNASNRGYALSSFQNPPGSGSAMGVLRMYTSVDGTLFNQLALPVYNCSGNVRDPSVLHYNSTYVMAHTLTGTGSCITAVTFIGFTSSSDLLTFGNEMQYSCPLAGFCWAPEWFPDPAHCTYSNSTGWTCAALSNLHVYFANSTNTVCCSAFTLYEMHPTASDFITNNASWSTPSALTISGGPGVPIDPFMTCRNSTTGADCQNPAVANDTYYLWYNSKASSTGCLNWASNSAVTGTFTNGFASQCFGFANYVEGPAVIHITPGSPGTWRVYMDNYQNTYDLGQLNYSESTDNWSTWSTPTVFTSTSGESAKQGTVIPYP